MIEIGSVSVNYYCLIVYIANSPTTQNFVSCNIDFLIYCSHFECGKFELLITLSF